MDGKKNLSAARKKLQEYKLHKGSHTTPTGGTTFKQLNETDPVDPAPTGNSPPSSNLPLRSPPPPTENIPEFLNNLSQVQNQNGSSSLFHQSVEHKIMNLGPTPTETILTSSTTTAATHTPQIDNYSSSPAPNMSTVSNIFQNSPLPNDHILFTPSAPVMHQEDNLNAYNNSEQNYPVSFFQSTSTPIPAMATQHQNNEYLPPTMSFNQQDYSSQPQPQTPLFYNVDGANITPMQQPQPPFYQTTTPSSSPFNNSIGSFGSYNNDTISSAPEHNFVDDSQIIMQQQQQNPSQEDPHFNQNASFAPPPPLSTAPPQIQEIDTATGENNPNLVNDVENNNGQAKSDDEVGVDTAIMRFEENMFSTRVRSMSGEHLMMKDNPNPANRRTPTPTRQHQPTLRKMSASSQEEKDRLEIQAMHRMKSVQDALELQLEELRRDNERLLQRQAELVSQIEDNEKLVQEIRRERDNCKEDAKKLVQPLNIKINNLYEQNQSILKNSNEVGMELRSKLQEKSKLYEDMEQAFIIVSKSKMDLAAELDQEKEKSRELEAVLRTRDNEIVELRNLNGKLEEKVKVEQQRDTVIHQLEDQRRQYQAHAESLAKELEIANTRLTQGGLPPVSPTLNNSPTSVNIENQSKHENQHAHSGDAHDHEHCDHDHGHNHDHHDHGHEHGHDHSHEHGHDHSHEHGHDHSHEHGHDHSHDHHHEHADANTPRPQISESEEMKRRLHHLEWENATFKLDLDKLAEEARERRQFEEKYNKAVEECTKLRNECQSLEILIVQLQGENDTIGDYIALYQSQRLALKESAKEKDVQLENLAKEREMLLRKLEELTQLLRSLRAGASGQDGNPTPHHQCPGHEGHHNNQLNSKGAEIEGKIQNLITEISSSSLIENFHPCAVCSGTLMNV